MKFKDKVTLVDCGSSRTAGLGQFLKNFGFDLFIVPLDEANAKSNQFTGRVVVTGGPHLFTEDVKGELLPKFQFLLDLKLPALCICLGHQALGLVHGASVFLGSERRDKDTVRWERPHPLRQGLPDESVFREDHCEGITLPPHFKNLGSSTHYAVEAMAHESKPHFGVQFHPEAAGDHGKRLLNNFFAMEFAQSA